jgi:hypothetical protein
MRRSAVCDRPAKMWKEEPDLGRQKDIFVLFVSFFQFHLELACQPAREANREVSIDPTPSLTITQSHRLPNLVIHHRGLPGARLAALL